MEQLGAVNDVGTFVPGQDARRNQQPIGKNGCLIGDAVAVGVIENENLVVCLLARFDVWVDFARRQPEPTVGIKVHLNWLRDFGIRRVEIYLKSIGYHKRRQLVVNFCRWDVLQVSLSHRG